MTSFPSKGNPQLTAYPDAVLFCSAILLACAAVLCSCCPNMIAHSALIFSSASFLLSESDLAASAAATSRCCSSSCRCSARFFRFSRKASIVLSSMRRMPPHVPIDLACQLDGGRAGVAGPASLTSPTVPCICPPCACLPDPSGAPSAAVIRMWMSATAP